MKSTKIKISLLLLSLTLILGFLKSTPQEDKCPICYQPKNEHLTQIIISPYKCKHSFFEQCIARWGGNCPICRAERIKQEVSTPNLQRNRNQKFRISSTFGKKHNDFVDIEYENGKISSIDGDGYFYEEDYW